MLKNNYFFILSIFLLLSFVACEDDKKEVEHSCQPEVSGGEVAGGQPASDMGLEGGQSLDQESQPTGGSAVDQEDPQGGVQGGEDLPVGGSDEVQGGVEGGSEEDEPEALPVAGSEVPEEVEEAPGGEVASEGGAEVEEESSEE